MKRFFQRKNASATPRKKSILREWINAVLFAVVLATLIRTFIFEAFAIPTGSMERTLLINDYLFVSKISYGPRIPMTPLALPLVHNTMPFTKYTPSYTTAVKWGYHRLPGLGTVKRNDVVVFNLPAGDTVACEAEDAIYEDLVRQMGRENVQSQYHVISRPVDRRQNYVKRCLAIGGDTLEIREGVVYVNGSPAPLPPASQTRYWIYTAGEPLNRQRLEEMGITDEPLQAEPGAPVGYNLTSSEAAAIKKFPVVKTMFPALDHRPDPGVFPHDARHPWNQDNFGPILIPRKGQTVTLDSNNIALYRRIITAYEGNRLEEKGQQYFINGHPANSYTFKMNYYWMMGDNRHNSLDSRFWGYVPEDHIVGRAWITWMSYGKDGLRWSRIFKSIR